MDGVNPAEGDTLATEEEDVILALCLRVKAIREAAAGRQIVLTRETDRDVSLDQRAQIANRTGAVLLVSVHCNAAANPDARGLEAWYHAQSPRGLRLATCLYDELTREFPELAGRGVRSDVTRYRSGFAVVRETICPAALVEWGFVTNPGDERW